MTSRSVYSYAAVEDALASVFALRPEQRGGLKGRLKHLQTLGVSPESPGRGRRISYTASDVYRWGVCLEFAEFGIDPILIARFDKNEWQTIQSELLSPSDQRELFIYFHPKLMFEAKGDGFGKQFHYWLLFRNDFATAANEALAKASTPGSAKFIERFRSRYGAINLTSLKRELDSALANQSR